MLAQATERNDLTLRLDERGRDELAHIAQAVNRLLAQFSLLLGQVRQQAESSSEISSEVGGMSQQAHQQANQTHQYADMIAAAMTQMAQTSLEVARHTQEVAQFSRDARQQGEENRRLNDEAFQAVNALTGQIGEAHEAVDQLARESQQIGSIVDTITSIADQTNLLALNAAIEAARAGEQGRGFAVVADEVRTLARRTADSTAEINKIIEQILGSTQDAVQAIGSSQQLGEQGVERVTQAGQMLRRIGDAITDIHGMNQQIATAAEQQTAAVEDISHNLVDIKSVAAEIQQQAERTQQASGQLQQNAQQLSDVVARFKQ